MNYINSMAVMLGVALAGNAAAQGTAIVKVETTPPGASGSVTFTGVPAGTVAAGDSIEQAGLAAGRYTSTANNLPNGLGLISITCSDASSASASSGAVTTSTATFNLEADETVSCVFRYGADARSAAGSGSGSAGGGVAAGGLNPADDGESTSQAGESEGSPAASDCEAPDLVPKAGRWRVANLTGSMVCGTMINMPLKASQEDGMLEIKDCGWTVVGTGMAEGTAPLTMRAVDAGSGRYTGAVGGEQDGIPMMINFSWQLNSAESINGDLRSEVTQQGMTCIMSRPFEMRYTGS